jgi:hypothetical protein
MRFSFIQVAGKPVHVVHNHGVTIAVNRRSSASCGRAVSLRRPCPEDPRWQVLWRAAILPIRLLSDDCMGWRPR